MSKLDKKLNKPLDAIPSNLKWLELEVADFISSTNKERNAMIKAEEYDKGKQDILDSKRMIIDEDGDLEEVSNLPNKHIIDNQYRRLVSQKVNHLVGRPFSITTDNSDYKKLLEIYFNNQFYKLLKNIGRDGMNGGISYLYPYYNENGELKFKRFKSYEIKPYWTDDDHSEIEWFFRYYRKEVRLPNGFTDVLEFVEVYTIDGVQYYKYKNGTLRYVLDRENRSYLKFEKSSLDGKVLATETKRFDRIPLIPFRTNDNEQPLLKRVKSLQDGINTILSTFENNMLEDPRNTILIIKNYDGQKLGEFRKNLATYGAVKVRDDGGVTSLTIEVNAENYRTIVELFKKAIIENGGGVDVKELRSGSPNQMNIQSMYYDIDIDANDTETEYQASMEQLKWFIDFDISLKGLGDFFDEQVEFVFNRDTLQDESTIIDNLMKLSDKISDEDLLAQVPWVKDAAKLVERKKQQDQDKINEYNFSITNQPLVNDNKSSQDRNDE